MKPKDITQKMLEKYNDVFADILNVLLMENQTQLDKLMPFRVFGYDGSEYVK